MFITKDKYNKDIKEAIEDGKIYSNLTIEKLKSRIESQEDLIFKYKDSNRELEAEVNVLNGLKNSYHKNIKTEVELEGMKIKLESQIDTNERLHSLIKEREEAITSQEESNYKKGYADGVADGVRKINEITAKDRENAMKVAMVSAASHTNIDTMKEINNEFRLTEGSSSVKKSK